ncbi:MAG: class II fructose-bisphosphate aldolase [Candidatus Marinimicrobia bacterium]|nr:class II fructose-bisphosphate aldolase [Candidatus Neomarinimicrobiota bacterium]
MPLILGRDNVLAVYRQAAERGWVLPAFNAENLTSIEAILSAARELGAARGQPDLPIITGLTRKYDHRSQAAFYTHTRDAQLGLELFMADLRVLTGPGSPFADLQVLVHLDHIQWDADQDWLETADLGAFSSIMYDASTLPFDENIARTRAFMERAGDTLLVEGACDEIGEAAAGQPMQLTSPEMAERYARETGVDILVANLGTEHRAGAADLHYHGDLARAIRARVGPRICLHGTSSVPPAQVRGLFADGVCKVNIWTAIERDSTPTLLRDMLAHAGRVVGPQRAAAWHDEGLLGPAADLAGPLALSHYTTVYRQDLVFAHMKRIVREFLELWYT